MASSSTVYILTTVISCLFIISSVQSQRLRNEADIMQKARKVNERQLFRDKSNSNVDQFGSNLLQDAGDMARRAEEALQDGIVSDTDRYNVSMACLSQTEAMLEALIYGEEWALKMIDAMGKPASGLLEGHFTWLGSYDECIQIQAIINDTEPIKGQYCSAVFGQQQQTATPSAVITIGVCVPSSCTPNDTAALLNTLLSLLPANISIPDPTVKCQKTDLELDARAIVTIVICSIFALVMAAGTAYDVVLTNWLIPRKKSLKQYQALQDECQEITASGGARQYGATDHVTTYDANGKVVLDPYVSKVDIKIKEDTTHTPKEEKQGTLEKVLLSFSVYTNAAKILNTNQPSGTLTAVNGIRFISMTWVILGHGYGFGLSASENMATFFPKMLKRFTFQAIANATVSVDTFFTLSGLLVAYLSLKEMKKRGGAKNFNWGMFYFHRFWRLTPPYMLFLMFYSCLMIYWSDGPLWPTGGMQGEYCETAWWKNLLYINNLVGTDKQCMGWSWYLANDMQFYVLSPIMLIPLYYSPVLGSLSCLSLVLINFISTGVISARDELGASLLAKNGNENMDDVYIKPWCRIGPYVVGFFAGYILYRTECRLRIPKILNFAGWFTATAIALLVLYGLYDKSGLPTLSVGVSAFYNATNRTAWGLAVAWVVVACATGNGGFINTLLSWKGIIPLSRLTYCAYLVHIVVMDTYFLSKRSLVYLTDLEEVYQFCGHLVISYIVAFIVSLSFESPMMGLEKAILGREKNS